MFEGKLNNKPSKEERKSIRQFWTYTILYSLTIIGLMVYGIVINIIK